MSPDNIKDHPILNEEYEYILGTSASYELYNIVKHMITMRHTGSVVIGKSRIGKTKAIDFVIERLRNEYGNDIIILKHPCSRYPTSYSYFEAFFSDILRSFEHLYDFHGNYAKKKSRIMNFLISHGMACKNKTIFLFLDEAQNLTPSRYLFFVDVSNELAEKRVTLLTLSIGEKLLEYQRTQLINANLIKIVARFMPRIFELYGLRSSHDVHLCLYGYDNLTEYPEGSGCSFTQYFFPHAFSAGFRLQNEAVPLWEAFMEIKKEHKITGNDEITMDYFVKSVHYIFTTYSSLDNVEFHISKNMWKEAVIDSGYSFYRDLVSAESKFHKDERYTAL